jgi:hypothetical protein
MGKPSNNWIFERSSGYAGYKCINCSTWLYENQPFKCDCNKDSVEITTPMKEEIEKLIEAKANELYPGETLTKNRIVFYKGAEFILDKYQGLSPATVLEMVEHLRDIFKRNGYSSTKELLDKADKELKG